VRFTAFYTPANVKLWQLVKKNIFSPIFCPKVQ